MRCRSSFVLLSLGCIVALSIALLQLKFTCHPISQTKVTDLPSLLNLLQQWEQQEADPEAARSVNRVAMELAKAMEAQRSAQSLPPPAPAPQPASSSCTPNQTELNAFHSLAIAGTQCHVAWGVELWGDPIIWGVAHHANSAAECCAACHAHQMHAARGGFDKGPNTTTCNTWVFCGDAARCGTHYRECWLKRLASPPPANQIPGSVGSMWTSGVVYEGDSWLQAYDSQKTLTLHLAMGNVVVELLPELAPNSVRELRRLAVLVAPNGVCDGCKFYRAETNFLVQGVLMHPGGYVSTPRNPNPPQKKIMDRGLVCWAGGAGGPDFFINLIEQPGFGDSHLCWGLIRDMTLIDAIAKLPTKPKAKATDMTFLAEELFFNMTLG